MVAILLLWAYAVKIRDVSFIDAFWAFGMVILAWASWLQIDGQGRRADVLLALTTIWGVRLAAHLVTAGGVKAKIRATKRLSAMRWRTKGWSWAKTALLMVF
jgi:steroid 5-alpha reductase family enzyme